MVFLFRHIISFGTEETMEDKTISRRLAEFALSMKMEDVPEDARKHGKLLLADTFGVAMSCQKMPHAQAVRKTVMGMKSAPQASLWGTDDKADIADAVLYNACLIHGADFDDTHVGGIVHPSAIVVAAAVTVGEAIGASGHDIYEAILCGWEIAVRLALAAKGRFHDAGYHATGIIAPFASACVAAKLMGDSADVLTNALGICGSQSAALQEFLQDGTWAKKIHPGWGCHSAMYALSMARGGFTGPKKVFEGKFGMWMTHLGGTDGLEEMFDDLGKVWHITEITAKLYPVCHMTHSFIDCMLRAIDHNGFTAGDIDSVECRIESRCYPIVCTPREAKVRPKTDYMMRFSLPYVVAMAAMAHGMGAAQIDLKYAEDPAVQALMDRIQCVDDDSKRNPGYFPGYMTIVLKDGRSFVMDQRYEMGTKQNPLDSEAVNRKLRDNLSSFYTAEQIDSIIENVNNIDLADDPIPLILSLHA